MYAQATVNQNPARPGPPIRRQNSTWVGHNTHMQRIADALDWMTFKQSTPMAITHQLGEAFRLGDRSMLT
jgi:hypothetical protein